MSDDLLKALKNSVYLAFDDGTNDYTTALKAADRIEELEAENKNLRYMIIDQINSTGDDPEIMAASRAEWAARAKAAEAKLTTEQKKELKNGQA